jgi:small-conductance mechanosensitive channel
MQEMNNLLEWLAKFFGHIRVSGIEALLIHALQAALVLLAAYVGLRILLRGIDRHFKTSTQGEDTDTRIYKRVCRYVVWTLGILIALHVAGIKLTSLFTTSGLFAVALGFSLKNIAENYVSGLIIKTDESVKHGDILDIDGLMVRVKRIGLRDTIVRTKDDGNILIPNSLLVKEKIGNYTLRDSLCRIWTTIGVSYSSDLKKVRDVLEGVCANFEGISSQHKPLVLLTDFGDSSVNYQVFVWLEDPWNGRIFKSRLNEALWWGLKEAEIEIAFPQLDVHLDKGSEAKLPQ